MRETRHLLRGLLIGGREPATEANRMIRFAATFLQQKAPGRDRGLRIVNNAAYEDGL